MTDPNRPSDGSSVEAPGVPVPVAKADDQAAERGAVQDKVTDLLHSVESKEGELTIGRILELLQYGHRIVRADLKGKRIVLLRAEFDALEAAGETFTYAGKDNEDVIIEAEWVDDEFVLNPEDVGEGVPNPEHKPQE